ncbi:MAG: tRNA pseudouridine(55) synthase TruB [Cyanobacteriota bacterium]
MGFLILDKPAGVTSHDCDARVRRRYGLRRVGHGGTLDPAVTGVLPLALGPATRLLPYLDGRKRYEGVIQLGVRTSSDDLEGEVLSTSAVPALTAEAIERLLAPFRGQILQRPPQVSAVHVEGERAYARARRGETMEIEARPVTIEQLELIAWTQDSQQLHLAVTCSAGTYIRSLARDLGEALGCGASLARLRRSGALGFTLADAVTVEQLDQIPPPTPIDPLQALGHLSRHPILESDWGSWRCGRALTDPEHRAADTVVVVLAPDGNLAGMARATGEGLLQPKLVLDAAG